MFGERLFSELRRRVSDLPGIASSEDRLTEFAKIAAMCEILSLYIPEDDSHAKGELSLVAPNLLRFIMDNDPGFLQGATLSLDKMVSVLWIE